MSCTSGCPQRLVCLATSQPPTRPATAVPAHLCAAVSKAFTEAKQRPRLADELPEYNIKTITAGGRAKASRRFSPVSYREHGLPVSENLLKQAFCASDIMYLLTDEGWQYLAVVIDLWSRVVIGWLTPQLACDALQMVLWRRRRPEQVIVHTVHDGQYCSADIRYC